MRFREYEKDTTGFLMSAVTSVSPHIAKTCPHGLPVGACPICSGMGGGSSVKKSAPKVENEMSYSQCYAIWMRMKAEKAQKQAQAESLARQIEFLDKMKATLAKNFDKLMTALDKIQKMLPAEVQVVFSKIVSNIIKPLVSLIQDFPKVVKNIQTFIQNIQRLVYVAAEKLAAVFGEIKNFIKRKLSENFKKFTNKVYKILNLFGLEDEKLDDDEVITAEINAFKANEAKTVKELMLRIFKNSEREEICKS